MISALKSEAAQQRDEADEGRMVARGSMVTASRRGVAVTKHHGGVVRPSQLIASVLRAMDMRRRNRAATPSAGQASDPVLYV